MTDLADLLATMEDKQLGFEGQMKSQLIHSISSNVYLPVTTETTARMDESLDQVAEIFNNNNDGFNKSWFVAGGGALDLAHGEITREHQDIDIAIFQEDGETLYQHLISLGYKVKRPVPEAELEEYAGKYGHTNIRDNFSNNGTYYVPVLSAEEFRNGGHNAFCEMTKSSEGVERPKFEIMLLERKDDEIIIDSSKNIRIPKSVYLNSTKYTTRSGTRISVTPPEVQIYYKLTDGREKDRFDIEHHYPLLSPEQKSRLDSLLHAGDISFEIEGQELKDIDELLSHAKDLSEQKITSKVPELTHRIWETALSGYRSTVDKFFSFMTRQKNITQTEFLDKVFSSFPKDYIERNSQNISAITKYLFSGSWDGQYKTLNEYTAQVVNLSGKLEEQLEPYIRGEIHGVQLWSVK